MDYSALNLLGRVERRLEESPLEWVAEMEPWSTQVDFRQTIRVNDQGYYLFLNALVAEVQPRVVLELGTCQGGSTLMMLLALPEAGHLASIDLGRDPEFLISVRADPRLHLIHGDSRQTAHFSSLALGTIDLLFIDTDHTAAQVRSEWSAYQFLMSPGGIVVMDDIHLNDMMDFWESLPYDKVDTGSRYHRTGFGIFIV